jgi:hypothetical protein
MGQFCSPYAFAFFKDFWSAFAVDCAVYASASHQRRVSRINNRISINVCYVSLKQANPCLANLKFVNHFFQSSIS